MKSFFATTAITLCLGSAATLAAEPLTTVFISHSSPSNTFWQAVKKGYDDACARVQARCQLVLTQTERSIEQAIANLQAAIARKPDAIVDKAYDAPIADARSKRITVLAVNVNDRRGGAGVHEPDNGQLLISGIPVRLQNPKNAMRARIETIYQYNSMVPTMSIARNLFIGREPLKASIFGFGLFDQERMRQESVQAIADVDLHLRSPDALVGELSDGQRQSVAIARAMHFKLKLLILDEPTNHLSVKETDRMMGFVKGLKDQGLTGTFISHNMQHVFQSCNRVVAMAPGEIVFDRPVAEATLEDVHEHL